MSLVAGARWSFQRIRVQIDRRPHIDHGYGVTGGYCLGGESARLRRHSRYFAKPS
jgi:hypothetical protein